MDWQNTSEQSYQIWLPYGLNEMCQVAQKNIIIISGASNGGKSKIALDIARNNLACNGGTHSRIEYFTCEMSPPEVKGRLLNDAPVQCWHGLNIYERFEDYATVIEPDSLNIIDYLEVTDKFYLMGSYIDEIHKSLRTGVAVICLQKHKNSDLGMGGQFSVHRARLYLNLDYNIETQVRTVTIAKCKHPLTELHPDGMQLDFKVKGKEMETILPWQHVTKERREKLNEMYMQQVKLDEIAEHGNMSCVYGSV